MKISPHPPSSLIIPSGPAAPQATGAEYRRSTAVQPRRVMEARTIPRPVPTSKRLLWSGIEERSPPPHKMRPAGAGRRPIRARLPSGRRRKMNSGKQQATVITDEQARQLAAAVRGTLLRPGDDGFDAVRRV